MNSPPDRRLDRGQTAQKTLQLPLFFSTLLPSDFVSLLMCSFAYCLPPLWERSLPERWDLVMHTRTALEQAPGLGQAQSSRPCRCLAQSSAVTRRPRRKKRISGKNLVLSLGKQYHFYMCEAFLWRNAHLPLGSLFGPAQACVLLGQRHSCHHYHSCQMSASWKNLGKLLPEGGCHSCSKHRAGRDGGIAEREV